MRWVFDDGGRAAAGFRGETSDCVCRAICIVTGLPYRVVYDDLIRLGRERRGKKWTRTASHPRTGVDKDIGRPYIEGLDGVWVPTMHIGSGCQVHLRDGELPDEGHLIVQLSKHLTTMIDGVIHDTYDPSRGGMRCVYGYWQF